MNIIKISKEKLLDKIIKNRNYHQVQYNDTLEGWQEQVLSELKKAVRDAKKGIRFPTYFNLPKPVDHTNEYDLIINQIEWNEIDQIELDYLDFNKFVLDNWSWKEEFLNNSALYSKI